MKIGSLFTGGGGLDMAAHAFRQLIDRATNKATA